MASRIRVHQIEGVTAAVGVVCQMVDGGRSTAAAPSVRVDPLRLIELLDTLDPTTRILVFLTEADRPDAPVAATRIDRLVTALADAPGAAAAIRRVPAVNAAKRVRDGVVIEAVDRAALNLLRTPEVVDRRALDAALRTLASDPDAPVSPTQVVAAVGGDILVVEVD